MSTKLEESKNKKEFSCLDMMEKMMGQSHEECNCEDFISKFFDGDEIPSECSEMMSQMNACCGAE